jgi:putative endonuclease
VLPRSKKKVFSAKQQQRPNFSLGLRGEKLAVAFLEEHGYKILTTNYQGSGQTEIDIIALDQKHQELVFVEVKTRANLDFGLPSEAVDQRKVAKMAAVAVEYREQHPSNLDYRFDIIAVCGQEIVHYENITWP